MPNFKGLFFWASSKTIELVEDKIQFFWYHSTENGRRRRLQIVFIKPILLVILFSVDFREIFDVFFWALLKTVEIGGFGNLLLLQLADL